MELFVLVLIACVIIAFVISRDNYQGGPNPSLARPQIPPKPAQPKVSPNKHPMAGFVFKDAKGFFDYQCQFGITKITKGAICYGLVLDDITDVVNRFTKDPEPDPAHQWLDLLLASPRGGHHQPAVHNSRNGVLVKGDLVAWQAIDFNQEAGWGGLIIARCAPEFNDDGVKVLQYF